MKLSEVPPYPAYLVFHDAFSNGEMDVWPMPSFEIAQQLGLQRNKILEENGVDECGFWKEYIKLPRKKIFKFHTDEEAKFFIQSSGNQI